MNVINYIVIFLDMIILIFVPIKSRLIPKYFCSLGSRKQNVNVLNWFFRYSFFLVKSIKSGNIEHEISLSLSPIFIYLYPSSSLIFFNLSKKTYVENGDDLGYQINWIHVHLLEIRIYTQFSDQSKFKWLDELYYC